MNPNLHLYGLGAGPNVNMLDNLLMASGFPATDQPVVPKPSLVPQYTYSQDINHHAMNLVQPQAVTSVAAAGASDPVHVIVYQNDAQQQQPISYKIPQLGAAVVNPQQNQSFVVSDHNSVSRAEQRVQYTAATAAAATSVAAAARQTSAAATTAATSATRHVQSPAERKKDIVAQAMQEQKIFEANNGVKAEAVVKQEPGVAPVKAGPAPAGPDIKPVITPQQQKTPVKRNYNKNVNVKKEPVKNVKREVVDILEDEDDGLTCRLCLASYWYKTEMFEHYKSVHSIADPAKYDKEEKEKKMRRIKEEQHRIMLAKKQREERERKMKGGRGGMIKLTSPGARPTVQNPGQRPSFQYRDGAFICDLCKESFSDGNDMVTHWKSHVKKQQVEASRSGGRGRGGARGRGRGRPMRRRSSSSDIGMPGSSKRRVKRRRSSSGSSEERPKRGGGGRGRGGRGGKAEKGKPRWTAYLLWSTRKRRDVVVDHPDWTFAQIAKWISGEWKQIDADEKDELQKEAEEMNELGIRKLPRDDDAPDPDKDTTDEDSDFEEGYRRKQKPKVRVKREKQEGEEDEGAKSAAEGDTSESDWEPEADIVPRERETSRSGRQRKRPSFFQEFESQENNLDNILADFEQTQAAEFGKPRPPKPPPKPASERKPRKRKPQVAAVEPEDIPVEVETLRSGRKRKVRRVINSFMDEEDEDDKLLRGASSDDDDFEPPPEDEVEKLEDEDDAIEEEEELSDDASDLEDSEDERMGVRRNRDMMALPIKKRGRPNNKKILTDYEIEEATRAAMYTRPALEIKPVPRVYSAMGLAVSKDVALDLIIAAVEAVEGPDPARIVAKKSAPAATENEDEDDNEKDEDKDDAPKFQFSSSGMMMMIQDDSTSKDVSNDLGDKNDEVTLNPLEECEGQSEERNPLDDDEEEIDNLSSGLKNPVNEEDALLETVSAASEQPPFTNECQDESDQDSVVKDNPLGGIDDQDSDKLSEARDPFGDTGAGSDNLDTPAPGQQPLSDEDLLTGPAHNLDDTQYKADYVDPNLEDIFK